MSSIWVVSSPPRWFMNPTASDTRNVPPYLPGSTVVVHRFQWEYDATI